MTRTDLEPPGVAGNIDDLALIIGRDQFCQACDAGSSAPSALPDRLLHLQPEQHFSKGQLAAIGDRVGESL